MKNLTFDVYQNKSKKTAIFNQDVALTYLALGLSGEAGEVAEKVKKVIRDKNGVLGEGDREAIAKEIGDVLWYASLLADYLGCNFGDVAQMNLDKLASRKKRNVLQGSGDNR